MRQRGKGTCDDCRTWLIVVGFQLWLRTRFGSCARPLWSLTVILAFAPSLSTRGGRSCVVCRVLCGGAVTTSESVARVRDVTSVQSDPVACSERITIVARAELGSILDLGYDLRCYEHLVAVFFRLV